nr:centrosomal protein of 290 kDa isoform X1 [Onthophagus taurus]
MDWNYIYSIKPNKIEDNEKDALLNTLAWYDIDVEEVDLEKCLVLFKITQEIMKFKSEQVEVLIAELDDLAKKQAEDELKKSELDSLKSQKSKKSSSLDYDELEEKYRELKGKLKQQNKSNEKLKNEITKLNQHIKVLEKDRNHLQNELESLQKDDVQSELSENTKDQHKELIGTIRHKNNQISQLLNDIEMVEGENLQLKEQILVVKDKLEDATKQINEMTKEFLASNVKFEEEHIKMNELMKENDCLKNEIEELTLENVELKKQLEDFALAIDKRVDEWKRVLDEKNEEIFELKRKILKEKEEFSEISDTFRDGNEFVLNKIIFERDLKINDLQSQLEKATIDMNEIAEILNKLREEKEDLDKKLIENKDFNKELKQKLKSSHLRTQNLQEEINYLTKALTEKDDDVNEMINKYKNENVDFGVFLEKYQKLKLQKRQKDKEIAELVRDGNNLQENFERFQKENVELRSRLGLNEEDNVAVTSIEIKTKKLERKIDDLKVKMVKMEEEKVSLRCKNQNQSKIINELTKKLNELNVGEILFDENEICENVTKESHEVVVEENEALRRGLHEILESLQQRKDKGYREINSETLENLLKALDSKHISGWYHSGMRLQAEIHTLQGSNKELREQLKIALKKASEPNTNYINKEIKLTGDNKEVISNDLKESDGQTSQNDVLIEKNKINFEEVEEKLNSLSKEYNEAKLNWENEKLMLSDTADDLSEKVEVLEKKLEEIKKFHLSENDAFKIKQVSELAGEVVILNRKTLYLKNENEKYLGDIDRLKSDSLKNEIDLMKSVKLTNEINDSLLNKITRLEVELKNKIDLNLFLKLQNNFDDLTIKHRGLLGEISTIKSNENRELQALNVIIKNLKEEKLTILEKTQDLLIKINSFEASKLVEIDKNIEMLTKKLSQCEINEITERQRANHMNNLYELVKEQLKNSEERLHDFEKYNKEIMEKNLKLQETIKNGQNQILIEPFFENDDDLKKKYENALIEIDVLKKNLNEIKFKNEIDEKYEKNWKSSTAAYEFEILSLKHQILDLQAAGDDKAVISRLSSDVVQARLLQAEANRKFDSLQLQFERVNKEFDKFKVENEEKLMVREENVAKLEKNVINLQEIIIQHRHQYLGYIPLISERKYIENILQINKDKFESFLNLQKISDELNEVQITKEQLKEQLEMIEEIKSEDFHKKISKWYNEKSLIQLQELKQRRKSEFLQTQLDQALEKIEMQNNHTSKLEEALFLSYQNLEINIPKTIDNIKLKPLNDDKEEIQKKIENIKIFNSQETQTIFDLETIQNGNGSNQNLKKIQMELLQNQNELSSKTEIIEQLKSKLTELEMNLSLFKSQLGDKQSQITFYEKHILELQSKKEISVEEDAVEDLKSNLIKLQAILTEKEEDVIKYQSLLKKDRDEHSLAAQRMREEVKRLQMVLIEKENESHENEGKAAVEYYIKQVNALVQHTNELHTQLKCVENQLESSREECSRWKSLSNDRLECLEKLRKDLEEMHKIELKAYQDDCEKWREEVLCLKTFVSKFQGSTSEKSADLQKLIKDKDNRIHELTVHLRQLKIAARKKENNETPRLQEEENAKKEIQKELEVVKKKCENLLTKEKNYREEIRNLKSQLMKRPISSSLSSQKSDIKDQLYKKITSLENENLELKENLRQQFQINETHRIKVAEDFDKWNKQKQFQQTADKLKIKLKEKSEECEKLQQTSAGYRILIEKLEREKHALEMKIKNFKTTSETTNKNELLQIENARLSAEIEAVNAKYEMAQHHSGGLGAVMLQEKLEAQERKIAILELAGKGTIELRNEIERLQNATANLHKANLRLEAENLEFKLDLGKTNKEVPHLKEQIQYLENYIEVLKQEKNPPETVNEEHKKQSELERTVFVLKRIVEKLQVENKRLQNSSKPVNEKINVSDETLRRNFYKLKDQYGDSIQKISRLEEELNLANNKLKQIKVIGKSPDLEEENARLKNELEQKIELLDKVKILLHRAASKEKALLDEVARLKAIIPCSSTSVSSA